MNNTIHLVPVRIKLTKQVFLGILKAVSGTVLSKEDAEEAMEALEDGRLDIEGYDHTNWVKFDKDNPDTYPPANDCLLFFNTDNDYEYGTRGKDEDNETFANKHQNLTHWHPWGLYPEPPR
jgi:hypothetical protein